MSTVLRALWWFGFLALLAGPLMAAEYTGKVVGVSDGVSPRRLTPR
jgi:hypothetical protein